MPRQLIILFGLALIVRLIFAALVESTGSFYNGLDSGAYLKLGVNILNSGAFVQSVESMTPEINIMPVYPWIIAIIFKVFGVTNYLAIIIFQVLLDSGTVLAIALTARHLHLRWFWPAGLLAAFLPNFVMLSSLILTETVFLFFFSWAIYSCLAAARNDKSLGFLLVAGILLALAFNTRPVLVFFIVLFVPLQAYLLKNWRGLLWRDAFLLALVPMVIMWLSVIPRYITTYHHYGQATLSADMGANALYWMYPCLRKIEIRCTDRADSANQNRILLETRLQNLPLVDQDNPVIVDMISRKLARELLFEVPIPTVAGVMALGGIRTLLTTSAYMLPPIFDKEPKFLSPASILGENSKAKVVDFLKTLTTQPLSLIWALCQGFLLLSRGFQLVGLAQGLRDRSMRSGIIFLLGILVYFLIINGPIGYARYRIPIEPVLVILTAPSLLWFTRVITRLIRYS